MYGYQHSSRDGQHWRGRQERGIALLTALIFLVILSVLGATAITVTTLHSNMRGNYQASLQAFQTAEAGAEEARGRLRANAVNPILDTLPTQTQWKAYVGSLAQAQAYGYDARSSVQVRSDSLQSALLYTALINHATDSTGRLLYWGDATGTGVNTRNPTTGQNIYVLTSYGSAGGARSTVQTYVTRVPPLPVPGALYVKASTTLQGSSTYITGQDDCGGTAKAGVATPLPETLNGRNTITQNGNPQVSGTPSFMYNSPSLNIQALTTSFKGSADFAYTVASATQTGTTTPGPGDHWGTPTPGATSQRASSCQESHIVYYNTGGTSLQLSGGVTGCGLLLVEGDLEIHGNFSWYGTVLVTGAVIYTGGGNKNITGALLSGGSVTADVIGGNANIVYCSEATASATQNRPLLVLSWGEL